MRNFFLAAFMGCALSVLGPMPAMVSVAQAQPAEAADVVQTKLRAFITEYVQHCNRVVRPAKASPTVSQRDGKYIATYIELDPASAQAQLMPAQGAEFSYLAKLTYLEYTYEAIGNSPDEAVNGVYRRVKSRRLTELPRYRAGKWEN